MKGRKPGQKVTLRVGTVDQPQKDHTVTVTLSQTKENGKVVAVIGIEVFTQPGWDYPFKVSVNLNNIGGPSAGLAFTLGIIDSLTGGNLTGGRTISATGTICANGSVGQVGGVPQKTVAVENAARVGVPRSSGRGVPGTGKGNQLSSCLRGHDASAGSAGPEEPRRKARCRAQGPAYRRGRTQPSSGRLLIPVGRLLIPAKPTVGVPGVPRQGS